MTSRAAPPARRGLPRRTEARAERTLDASPHLPSGGGVGRTSPRTPASPARGPYFPGLGGGCFMGPPISNTGVTFLVPRGTFRRGVKLWITFSSTGTPVQSTRRLNP